MAAAGPVEVIVAESLRMQAILETATAVRALAESLRAGATVVNVSNCSITGADVGISVRGVE
jgi:hypothetical protein